jgi:hypothetical protein
MAPSALAPLRVAARELLTNTRLRRENDRE